MKDHIAKIKALPIWHGVVDIRPLAGGITNVNYLVSNDGARFVVRLGEDIGEHQIMRFNELAASRAAHSADISPRVVYAGTGVMVLDYIASHTLDASDVRDAKTLLRIVQLVKKCHTEIPQYLRGATLIFWVFHVLRDYAWTLRQADSRHINKLPELMKAAELLERASGPHDLVFGHNDLLAANFLDDGKRLWLVDWDYAGFNSPLFDLGGLASNNQLDEKQQIWLLENYFERPVTDELTGRYQAMKCASLLRETMWSMVSEIHSKIDFDYPAYTAENLARFEKAYLEFDRSQK